MYKLVPVIVPDDLPEADRAAGDACAVSGPARAASWPRRASPSRPDHSRSASKASLPPLLPRCSLGHACGPSEQAGPPHARASAPANSRCSLPRPSSRGPPSTAPSIADPQSGAMAGGGGGWVALAAGAGTRCGAGPPRPMHPMQGPGAIPTRARVAVPASKGRPTRPFQLGARSPIGRTPSCGASSLARPRTWCRRSPQTLGFVGCGPGERPRPAGRKRKWRGWSRSGKRECRPGPAPSSTPTRTHARTQLAGAGHRQKQDRDPTAQ